MKFEKPSMKKIATTLESLASESPHACNTLAEFYFLQPDDPANAAKSFKFFSKAGEMGEALGNYYSGTNYIYIYIL